MALTIPVDDIVARNANGLLGKHESWSRVRLGEVAAIQSGAAFKSEYFNRDGRGVPLLRIRDVLKEKTTVFYDGPFDSQFLVEPGELVIGMDGEFNCALWAGPAALLNQRVCRIVFRDGRLDKQFAFLVLQGYLDAVQEVTSSVTVKHLSSQTVAEIPLPLPPLNEQNRIVTDINSYLIDLTASKDSVDESERALGRFRNSILTAAVLGHLAPDDDHAEPASELLRRILAERRSQWEAAQLAAFESKGQLPSDDLWKSRYKKPAKPEPPTGVELPPNWTWATVDQLATRVQYGSSSKTSKDASGIPVLRMGNLINGRLKLTDLTYLARDHREFPALFLDDGDVLFNRTNSAELVGKAAVFRNELEPCSFASYLIRVSLNPGYMPEFLVYFLLSPLGRSWVQSVISQQVGQANVNGTKLRQLTVPVPPLKQQKRICSIVNDQLNLMDEMRNKIVGMRVREEHLRLSLLRRAFTGKPLRQSTNYEQRPPSHSSQWMAMS